MGVSRGPPLTNLLAFEVSMRLNEKYDIRNLFLFLRVELYKIEAIFQNNINDREELVHKLMTEWRKRMMDPEEAYCTLWNALTHCEVNLSSIAYEVLKELPTAGSPDKGSVNKATQLQYEQKFSKQLTPKGDKFPLDISETISLIVPPGAVTEESAVKRAVAKNENLPLLEIQSMNNLSSNKMNSRFLKHVQINFGELENIDRLGVKVDDHYILQQESSACNSSILHTFYTKNTKQITKHFSKFEIYCKDHEDEPGYDSILLAVLFGKKSVVEKRNYVDLKVVLDTERTCREGSSLGDVIPCKGCNIETLPDAAYLHFEGEKLANLRSQISFSIQPSKDDEQITTKHNITIDVETLPSEVDNSEKKKSRKRVNGLFEEAPEQKKRNLNHEHNPTPPQSPPEFLGRELTDVDISNISSQLPKDGLQRLALHLEVPSAEIDRSRTDNTTIGEAANHILTNWLHSQNDRTQAYSKMGDALVNDKVKLNLIAGEVLDFPPKQK